MPSRTACSSTRTSMARLFLTVVRLHSSAIQPCTARSTAPCVIIRTGRWPRVGTTRLALAALGDEAAMKALSGCKHTFKVHDQHQSTSQTRHMNVELTCGCEPSFSDDAAMNDLFRQLRGAFGWQIRSCTGGSYGQGHPRLYGIDIAASASKVVRTS